ncbi:MAG TPA: MBL fold metallo-hydrolase [Firmicutes bacterium]|nr:MBL fold metallo-hydrolase [Bacillota bacterium]
MSAVKLTEGIYWVGAVDWNIRHFHGPAYSTHHGVTYNSYLIIDEKVALVDTVFTPFADELIGNISDVIDPARIDYVIANHVEVDHSGALPRLMSIIPNARVFCSLKGVDEFKKHYAPASGWEFHPVKTGQELKLGKRTLSFIEAPMLHWPDSMFTYVKEDGILMSNDAFGQHIATTGRFDDEVNEHELMREAAKYYANILMPFSVLVLRKLKELQDMKIPVNMIAPSHGIIWRKDPGRIIDAYAKWAEGKPVGPAAPGMLVVYETMWGSTEKMAKAILQGAIDEGVDARLYRLFGTDESDIITELLTARALVVGCSTINRGILPTVSSFLDEVRGLKPVRKIGAAFGSYGWNGGAVETIEERLRTAGIELAEPGLGLKWVPTPEELESCRELGRKIARRVRAGQA